MNLNDFQNLLLNREELEKALGVTINKANGNNDYLEDYRMFAELRLHDVVCLYLDLHPLDWNAHQHPRYEVIYNAIQQSAENNYIPARIEHDINGNITDVYLAHDTAKQWAKTHGLKWNVPPYRPLIAGSYTITNNNNPDEISCLNAIIEQQTETIARLKAEIESLKKTETAESVVNYDECSIYGHTSENLEMLFTLAKKIASKCDPDNPHSYPNKDDFLNYVKKYHSDSSKLSEAFYQILTPEKVKNKGRTPKGVETFKGFI